MAYEDYQYWKTTPLTAEPLLSIIIQHITKKSELSQLSGL